MKKTIKNANDFQTVTEALRVIGTSKDPVANTIANIALYETLGNSSVYYAYRMWKKYRRNAA